MSRSPISKLITAPLLTGVAARRAEPAPAPLAAAVVLALLRGYKIIISPLFTGCCRFQPSCADYMREAVMVHGAMRGVWLGVKRLARCHPLGSHGFDPVPPGLPAFAQRASAGKQSKTRPTVPQAGVGIRAYVGRVLFFRPAAKS